MTPFWGDSAVTLFNADCRAAMAELEPESVDLVIWDPPYNMGKAYDGYEDNLPAEEHEAMLSEVASELLRVAKPGVSMYGSCSVPMIWTLRPLLESAGWTFADLLIWYGPNGFSNRVQTRWAILYESIFHMVNGECRTMMRVAEARKMRVWYHGVITEPRPQSNFKGHQKRVHPTQKPVGLYVKLMAQHYPGVVLDPMAGVGTTGLAAKVLGWQGILIEQSELYCKRAAARLSGGIERLDGQQGLEGIS